MKKIVFFVFCFGLIFTTSFAQFSKTHYIPPLSGSSSLQSEEQYLYISTPNINPVNFKIIELGATTILGTVSRDTPYIYYVGFGNNTQLHVDGSMAGAVNNNKGYIIEAEDLVYVSARVTAGNGNQAGELVSKGLASLGTHFRIGAFTNEDAPSYGVIHYTFVSILATENNTTVDISDLKPGITLMNSSTGDTPFTVVLNSGESYVYAVQGPNNSNRDGLIGSLVTSDKPIAVNCGSFGGTNGEMSNIDLGFDQIVSSQRTGKEYVFIKSTGMDNVERILLVADVDNTEVFLDGSTTAAYTLNAGQYVALHGYDYNANGNLFVRTSENVFAYQSIGDNGLPSQANQELFFVPPLSCQTPHVIDNIPAIDYVGSRPFVGRVTIVTQTGATLNFIVDGVTYDITTLPGTVQGPVPVVGNPNYETYTIVGLTGNVSAYSTGELYLAAYGSSNAATFGGFYSGFTFKPEVTFNKLNLSLASCIPNTVLSVNTLSPFDTFQWYFNNTLLPTATSSTFTPTAPGNYFVSATISSCGSPIISDIIPVSDCALDNDNDGVPNSSDLDNDNDGLTNCTESLGNQNINLTNTVAGIVQVASYTNSFTGAISTTGTGTPSATPISGDAQGNFVTEAALGKQNTVSYTTTFSNPISLSLGYATAAQPTDLLTTETEIRVSCPVNRTLTVINPNNEILIDTNYDGIFENGVTEYSSFEIRFRLNNSQPLTVGTGTFFIKGDLITSLTVTNINLSDFTSSRATFNLVATCILKDSDLDGVADQNDFDSDNDTIPDWVESQGNNVVALSGIDSNRDGIDDVFGTGITPSDTDNDTHPNYLDADSDNDGIFDIVESGSPGNGSNITGSILNATPAAIGSNGLSNALETSIDSGILNYTIRDSDGDGILNYIESDSDGDGCSDVIEAGYTDANNDSIVGNATPTVTTANGQVASSGGYTVPNVNYTIPAPIIITTQPLDFTSCELQSTTFSVSSNAVNSYQWEVSTNNGVSWTPLTNNAIYTGTTTASLTITSVVASMSGNLYRVFLNKNGNSCGLYSTAAVLTTYALPVVTTPITLKQCDDDTDGISLFNLTQKNDVISSNFASELFTYYTTLAGATTQNASFLINNPIAFSSGNTSVFARVENSHGCYRVAKIDLVVAVTQIPASLIVPNQYICDDYVDATHDDRDGISHFNFTSITNSLQAILPSTCTIRYYKSESDFLAETDASGNSLAIVDPSNYRNEGYPVSQKIWVRVDSTLDNSCYGFKTFMVVVEALPFANPINTTNLLRHCDDDQDGKYGFDTSTIEPTIVNGQSNVVVKYYKSNGTPLSSPLPNPFVVNGSETITIRVYNSTTQTGGQPCYDEESLHFLVDDLPQAFPIPVSQSQVCDDEANSLEQDGVYGFNTTTFQSTLLNGQTGMNVYYFDQNNNSLPSPLPNPYFTSTQNITVHIENPINTSCIGQTSIPFIIHPRPIIDQEDTVLICLPDTQTTLDAGIIDDTPTSAYTYQWYKNNQLLPGKINPTLVVNSAGNYSVHVKNLYGCSTRRTITVIVSEIASIQNIAVADLTEINSILVTVTGSGHYEYSLDDSYGPYRESNFFNNVPFGLHELYVRDQNGCGLVGPIPIAVLGIPQYFTPNADGYHDYWNLQGVAPMSNNARSIIYIFDRFGKLIKQIQPISEGWDGTYNGNELPADDYWYTIQLADGRLVKGHFALKR
jgi:gliding motility-associated-like protein